MILLAVILTVCLALFFVGGTIAGFLGLFFGVIPDLAIWGYLILFALGLIVVVVLLYKQ
jgi:hypothetical protein